MSANEMNLSSESLQSELSHILAQSIELAEQIAREIQSMAIEFRDGLTPELALEFDESLSAIQSLMASMMTMQAIAKRGGRFSEVWNDAYPIWQETEVTFKNSLNELLRSYGHEDYIGLADVLEGEFYMSLCSWRRFVTKMHENLRA